MPISACANTQPYSTTDAQSDAAADARANAAADAQSDTANNGAGRNDNSIYDGPECGRDVGHFGHDDGV